MIDVEGYKDGLYFTNYIIFSDPQGNQPRADLSRVLIGVDFYDEVSGSEFSLGNVTGKRVNVRISNHPDEYETKPFTGFNFLNGILTIWCESSYTDYTDPEHPRTVNLSIQKGVFNVINATVQYDVIELDAIDSVFFLDKKYVTNLEYPATLKSIFEDAISVVGISTNVTDFDNSSYTIQTKPDNYTFRNIFGWIAMMAGCNARFNNHEELEFVKFSSSPLPDSDAKSAYDLTLTANTITITGIKVINSDNLLIVKGDTSQTAYYLVVKDNPFIDTHEDNFAEYLYTNFNGFTFRNFDGTFPGNPLVESYDPIKIRDRDGNIFQTIITSVEYNVQGSLTLKCAIDNPTINQADYKTVADQEAQTTRDKMKEYSNNYILFTNHHEVVTDGNGTIVDIADQEFAMVRPAPVMIFMEFLINVNTTQSSTEEYDIYSYAEIVVNYYYDNMEIPIATWKPKDSFDDGDHWLELSYLLDVADLVKHKWKVAIQSNCGVVKIKKSKARNVMMGQGLIGNLWDGTITVIEQFEPFDFTNMAGTFTDSATASVTTPKYGAGSDNFPVITFMSGMNFTDSAIADDSIVMMFNGDGRSDVHCGTSTPDNIWMGPGYVIGPNVSVLDHVTVECTSGIEFLVSFADGPWVGLQNGTWVEDASMTKAQLEAITQSQWTGYPVKFKATLSNNALLGSLTMHGVRISS